MVRMKLGMLGWMILFGFYALLYNEYWTFLLFFVVCLSPLALWLAGMVQRHYMDAFLESGTMIETKDKPYSISIRLKNRSVLPIAKIQVILEYRNCFYEKGQREMLTTSLDSKEEQFLSLTGCSAYCGTIEFKLVYFRFYDGLGLWSHKKKLDERAYLTILPKLHLITEPIAIDNPNILVDSERFSLAKSGDDVSELFGIKEYEQGDKMNRIHWKLSLKQDQLLVKQFGYPINCAVVIMIDFYQIMKNNFIEKVDAILETALSLSLSMVYQSQIHYIIWYDAKNEDCRRARIEREEDVYEVLSELLLVAWNKVLCPLITYQEAEYSKEQYTNIFYLTSACSEDMVTQIGIARRSAITHILLITDGQEPKEEWKKIVPSIHAIGMTCNIIRCSNLADDIMQFV